MVKQQVSTAGLNIAEFHELTFPYTPSRIGPDFTLDENLAMPTLLKRQMNTVPKTNLGSLDMLPVELMQPILAQLDLRTLEDFRRVNQRALQLVSSVPQYKAIETYALDALRGILSTGIGRWTTCETLYKTLCTAKCEYCGEFAGYLYILRCTRACFECFNKREVYLPLQYDRAIKIFGLNDQILATLPQMISIPGTYTIKQERILGRHTLVDPVSAQRACIELHGSTAATRRHAPHTTPPARIQPPAPPDEITGEAFRYMAIVHMPWLDPISKDVEPGRYCIGCTNYTHEFHKDDNCYRILFTADAWFNDWDHMKWFGPLDHKGQHKYPN
jgi:hypothetical protein